jgi:hypothetical protein
LLLASGKKRVAVVSVETLTIPESLVREVRRRLPAGVGLFMAASHTHAAPDSQMLNDRMTFAIPGIATYRRRQLAWYADRIAAGVRLAMESPRRALPYCELVQSAPNLNRARRDGARVDATARAVRSGKPLIVHFGAHPTLYDETELRTRGDWPGEVMHRTGGLVLLGPIGDASPVPLATDPGEAVSLLSTRLLESLDRSGRVLRTEPLEFVQEPIRFGNAVPHPSFAQNNGVPEALAKNLVTKFAPPKSTLCALRIGKLVLIGVPGEPSGSVGRQIAEAYRRRGLTALVVSHVNGWAGYILDPAEYRAGGYEADLAFFGPGAGDAVAAAAKSALSKFSR